MKAKNRIVDMPGHEIIYYYNIVDDNYELFTGHVTVEEAIYEIKLIGHFKKNMSLDEALEFIRQIYR
jgi:hypothetical protein